MIMWPHPTPQAWRRLFGLGLGLGIAALAWTLPAKPGPQPALAQAGNGWRLYGHDNGHYGIIEVDTASGRARTVGATGFDSGSAAMAAAGAEVLGPGGRRELLDPNKPPSPANPPRECLTLRDRSIPFHPLWNGPIWRVGCP